MNKPLIAKQKYRLNRRLVIFALIFTFFTFITALLHQLSMWNTLPQETFIPNWLFYPLVVSFAIAFVDMILWFGFLLFIEFLGIMAVVYVFSFTHLYSFDYIRRQFGNNTFTAVFSAILLVIDVIWYFNLFAPIHALLTRTYFSTPYTRAQKKYEKTFNSNKKEPNSEEQKHKEPEREADNTILHTKEELGRLLNLWQQKYSQATTDEERKMANEMILKYTIELEKLKVKNGTTPERAKLTTGGDNE
ncbi:hypothetical protein ACLIKE_06995 [Ferroplasma acidiphilum]|uniref:Multipass membrane protein n=1 Tax=Ferroplasma acidiphilum TaxID=74969 RepID=A0A7K4FMH6_9ARCH|nr:hypothetical protein [Ferroplasma acidiphilum]NOL60244.1 hypothetical protein [Ferroplasma acidiphilum]